MRKLFLILLVLSGFSLFAQTVRYDGYAAGAPGATVQWCNSPAVIGSNGACTNLASTYNLSGTLCPSTSQDTAQPATSTCSSTTDIYGYVGVWANPGNYQFTVCGGPRLGKSCLGPFTASLSLGSISTSSITTRYPQINPMAYGCPTGGTGSSVTDTACWTW